jgi:hypothetical protein
MLTFTVECHSCGRSLRPTRFLDEADTDEDDFNAIGDEDSEAEKSDEADLPRYGVAWFNCDCGHGFASHAERAPLPLLPVRCSRAAGQVLAGHGPQEA